MAVTTLGSLLAIAAVFAPALSASAQPSSALAGTTVGPLTGSGVATNPQSASSSCPTGAVVTGLQVGLQAAVNTTVTSVAVICTAPDGTVTIGSMIGFAGSPTTTGSCTGTDVGLGIYGYAGSVLDGVGLRCGPVGGTATNGPLVWGGSGFPQGPYDCPAGFALTGLTGVFGNVPFIGNRVVSLTGDCTAVVAVTSISPNFGAASGGTLVALSGSGFTPDTTVSVDGISGIVPTAIASDGSSLLFVTPPHAAGPVDVTVTNANGTSAPVTFTYGATPSITTMSPGSGPLSGGTVVTVNGSGFTPDTRVTVDGVSVPPTQIATDGTSLTFATPAHAAGAVNVTVTNANGTSNPATFTYAAVPAITSISPASGPTFGGTQVTVSGSGFVAGTTVTVGGVSGIVPTSIAADGTSLTFTTPPHAAGAVEVTVTNAGGTSNSMTFTYEAPVPAAPPEAATAPGAYSDGSNLFVVYTGSDLGVWQKTVGSGAPAEPLGGTLIGAPAPIDAGGTRIVFGQGSNHELWEKVGDGPWTSLGGNLTSQPGAAAVSISDSNDYRVYVRGTDGAVWARAHNGSGWSGWYPVGGSLLDGTGPSAAFNGSGFFVLVTGTDRGLWMSEDGEGVSGFASESGQTNTSPALVYAPSSGSLVLFAQGTNQEGYFLRAGITGWETMGGFLTSGMGGTSTAGNWYAYGMGGNNEVWQHAGTAGAIDGWTQVTP